MGPLVFVAIYFGLGAGLGLSRIRSGSVIVTASFLVFLGSILFVPTANFLSFIIIFGPVIGISIALGRGLRLLRARE